MVKKVFKTEKDLKQLFPEKSWNKLHLQIIFMGESFVLLGAAMGCNVRYANCATQTGKRPIKTKQA